jgi:hypothetical protein
MKSLKKTCGAWTVVYLVCALLLGFIAGRRFLIAAIPGGLIGGGILWVGIAYLSGIATKVAEARKLRSSLSGDPPRDGEIVTIAGRIMPISETLTSPFDRAACVAYNYKIQMPQGRNSALWEYQGVALAPSVIQGPHGTMKILALPELDVPEKFCRGAEAERNAAEFVAATEFTVPIPFKPADTKSPRVRYDHRRSHPEKVEYASLFEKVVTPGQEVCAIGMYSAAEGGLTHEPDTLVPTLKLMKGDTDAIQRTLLRRSIGNALGGLFFIALTLIGVALLYIYVPLEAGEQMSRNRTTWWWEVRLERFIDKELKRPPHNKRQELTPTMLSAGEAHGRIEVAGREVNPTAATASYEHKTYTVAITDGSVTVANATINVHPYHLAHLDLLGTAIPQDAFEKDGELEVLDYDKDQIEARITYLDGEGQPRCRIAFKARVTSNQ